ncbi:type I polyketide synthase [Aquimarina sediminis]|uniref:type I polyketide synthase n=1 Tax=Aquimarina sediminis TaxID=2070536 RepID=UPI000CA00281|nr:type I polyketide synthase [Aquimarina sediminis]
MNNKKPIAIVGIGCRFPGLSSSPEKFWEMLVKETDTIVNVPSERWDNRRFYDDDDAKPGKIRAKQGGFLKERVEEFDPLFFGISPREAESIDPQERMLLEVAYEAMEDAGIPLEELKGSKTGVFIGGFTFDNYILQVSKGNRELINSHTATGVTMTMLSNRLSYTYDLKGPSLSIDTACSSSLVATHYACQSIWNEESSMALVGGVNVMMKPENSILMSKGKFLSKHSRCKAFDSDAGGYVRGEGAGMVLLKPLEEALKDNDRVYAVINGTGANQDGQTNGITVPNGESQKELIRKIYKEHNIDRKDIHYVEAHGTGTPVGDPIEFNAINEALSENGDIENKCLVGSVKTNIGHLEAGAGVAGLIKTALCLHKNAVPANLHFNTPNPALNYEKSILKVPTSLEKLPEDKESFASVNSFGYGGTNAHAVLKQFSPEKNETLYNLTKEDAFIFPICGKSKKAVDELASKYKEYINDNEENFVQILSNVIYRRSHHSERLAIVASSKDELISKIEAYEEEIVLKGVSQGSALEKKPEIVFVYTGMGPQWWKMGKELIEKEPVFYEAVLECEEHFKAISGWSILEELKKPEETSKIKETYIAQPANFIIQVALTRLLEHYGVTPNAVVGHSVGEVTSTYISGALSLQEALLVSYHRSRLQHLTSGKGTMLAVGLPESEVAETIKEYKDVSMAAINSPNSVTLSGEQESLEKLAKKYESMQVFHRLLDVTVPYHSPVMKLIEGELLESLKELDGAETTIDLYSTVTANKISGKEINNEYWWKNVREPVHFAKTIDSLAQDNYTVFIEVGPHPVLKNSMVECVKNAKNFHFLQTLNRKESEQLNFFENLSTLFTLGYPLKWDRWVDKLPHFSLPSYPWQKEYYWKESKKSQEERLGRKGSVFLNSQVHSPQLTYEVELNKFFFPFLNDHVVHGKVVFPGAGYVAAGIAFYQYEISQAVPFRLDNIKFHQMLAIDSAKVQNLYTSFNSENNHFNVLSKDEGDNTSWLQRATGKFVVGKYTKVSRSIDIKEILNRLDATLEEDEIYEKLSKAKLEYGPYFRTIKAINLGEKELVAHIKGHPAINESDQDYFIHPTLLDACFQSMIVFDSSEFVPVSIGKIHCYSTPGDEFLCYSRLKGSTSNSAIADLIICDKDGNIAIEIEDFKCQELVSSSPQSEDFLEDCMYQTNWLEEQNKYEVSSIKPDQVTYIFTHDYSLSEQLMAQIDGRVVIIESGTDYRELGHDHYEVNLEDLVSASQLWENNENTEIVLISLLSIKPAEESIKVSEDCLKQMKPIVNLVRLFSNIPQNKVILNLITQGSQVVLKEDKTNSLESSAIHGLGRLIGNELPNFKVRLIDLEENVKDLISSETWKLMMQKINTTNRSFEEIAIREDVVYKKIMQKWIQKEKEVVLETVRFTDRPLKLEAPQFISLDELYFGNLERIEPKEGEIEISIDNTSINFKDYLKVSSKISNEALEGTYCEEKIGLDCTGVVAKVGPGVTKFNVGDKVIGFAAGTFQSYTTTSEYLATKCPENLDIAEANVLTSYITVLYSLGDKAGLKKGEKVLIHNATGGVGLAAINYAKMVGAEIYATAGTEEKRDYLKSIGITHIYSSRNLDFSKKIMEETEGKGVDVVLSALPGEMLYQSFSVLAPYGTYLEIGKKDIIDNASLPMKFFNKNLSYISIDMDRMLRERQEKISSLLDELSAYLASGDLQSLPVKVFTPDQISEAFKLVDESKHIGKVIIDFKDQLIEVESEKDKLFKADKSYLVTGGTKGLGLEIGKWMVDNGAQNIALLSRSGLKNTQTKREVDQMRKKGVNVQVYAVDVAEPDQMTKVFSQIEKELPPLVGIFHCAMVLDDGFLLDMNDERFRKVLRPKVDGAMNLHHLSKELELDHFVLFSSISSLIGNMGQANYVAANSLLDSFAYMRRSQGLVATTINLGVLAESGVVARSENLEKILQGTGIHSFTNEQVFMGLARILQEKPTQIGFFDLNWKALSKNVGGSGLSLFEELIKENANTEDKLSETQASYLDKLLSLESNDQQEFIVEILTDELAKILKMSKEQIRPDKGINFLGIDSILSVELIRRINDKLAIEISPIEFLSGPSVNQLSTIIIEKIMHNSELELA